MTTDGLLGKRRLQAVRRIEQRLVALSGGRGIDLPRSNRHGEKHLIVEQLEAIANFLDMVEFSVPSKYASMTLVELKALAKERGGLLATLTNKSTLIPALEAADRAAEQVTT